MNSNGGSSQLTVSNSADDAEHYRRQLEVVCNNASVALFIMDEKQQCVFMNPAAETLTGFRFAEVRGRALHDVIHHTHPDGTPFPLAECPIDRAFPQNNREQGEEVFVHKDGSFYPVFYTASPIRNAGGIVGTIIEVRGIAHEKEAQDALRRSEERYKRAAEAGRVGIWEFDFEKKELFLAPHLKAMLGYADHELPNDGEVWAELIHPDDRERVLAFTRDYVAGRVGKYELELRRRHRDGSYRWFLARATALRDAAGQVRRMVGSNTDITELKQTQEALGESEALLRAIVRATPECVKIVSPEGSLVQMNPAGLGMIEAENEQAVCGACVFELIAPQFRKEWIENHRRVCAGESLVWQFQIIGLRGTRRWMETHAVPLPLPDGKRAQLAVTREITERKRIEEEREHLLEAERAARSEAERNLRLKDEFLATLSHELRTPLNAILGWANILRTSAGKADIAQGVEVIERNARSQAQIIEDLLDMSRIISGKIRLDVQQVDLPAVIDAAIETVRPAAQAREIHLTRVVDPHAAPIAGDPSRLQQILWNLLSNGIKFTPRGGLVQVRLARVNSHVELSVSDSGQGIKPEFLPYVFDRFRQADASTTRRHGGLGLGLAIVKNLVEMHGGSIRAMSSGENAGSTFIVTLPVASVVPGAPDTERQHPQAFRALNALEPALSLRGVRVLVVDDERDGREVVKRVLEDREAEIATAGSAAEAFQLLAEREFDVLVSDVGMPGEDGYSLIRKIRRLPAGRVRGVPAIALTAFARSEDRRRAILSGFHMHIAKPAEPAELIAMVASLAGRTGVMEAEERKDEAVAF